MVGQATSLVGACEAPSSAACDSFGPAASPHACANLLPSRLAGPTPLRFTVLPDALDIDYLAFVVADGCDTIKFSRDGNGNLVLTWGSGGTLQCRTSLTSGSWQDVTGATTPYTVSPGGANGPTRYYRIS